MTVQGSATDGLRWSLKRCNESEENVLRGTGYCWRYSSHGSFSCTLAPLHCTMTTSDTRANPAATASCVLP